MFKKSITIILIAILALTACQSSQKAVIESVYQPLQSGMVHTWIQAKLDDGTEVDVVLPDSDSIWNKARSGKGKEIYVKKSGDKYEFDKFGY